MYVNASALVFISLCCSFLPIIEIIEIKIRYYTYLTFLGFPLYSIGGYFDDENSTQCFDAIDCASKQCSGLQEYKTFYNLTCGDSKEDYSSRVEEWMNEDLRDFETYMYVIIIICLVHTLSIVISLAIVFVLKKMNTSYSISRTTTISLTSIVMILNITSCIGCITAAGKLNKFIPNLPEFFSDGIEECYILVSVLISLHMSIETFSMSYCLIYVRNLGVNEFTPLSFTRENSNINYQEKDCTMSQRVVVVDGNIASGKTSYISFIEQKLKEKGMKVKVIKEPLELWQDVGIIQEFYNNEKRWGYSFQTFVYITRIQHALKCLKEDYDIFIMERSWFTDTIFMNTLHKRGDITNMEMEMYRCWCDVCNEITFEFDKFIYITCSPDICYKRMIKRSRNEESAVSIEYLADLHSSHEEFFDNFDYEVNRIENNEDYRGNKEKEDYMFQEFLRIVEL